MSVQATTREAGRDLAGEGRQAQQQVVRGDGGCQTEAEAQSEWGGCRLERLEVFPTRNGGEQRAEAGAELATEEIVVEPRQTGQGRECMDTVVLKPGGGLGECACCVGGWASELETGKRSNRNLSQQVGGLLRGE